MKLFNVIDAPLTGTHLIEASAGTGKTYSIASLFLRLVLESTLAVDKILVLTYTRAATMELKERIRNRLLEMKQALALNDAGDDALCRYLLQKAQNENLTAKWTLLLEGALADFDNANIYNFHQFCQKVVKDYAVETGGLFDAEIMADNSAVLEQAADDFWRKSVYHANPVMAGYLSDKLTPKALAGLVRMVTSFNSCAELSAMLPPLKSCDQQKLALAVGEMERLFRQLQNDWLLNRAEIVSLLKSDVLYKNYYADDMAAVMDAFAGGFLPYPLPPKFEKWQADNIAAKTKKGLDAPRHAFFELCQELGRAYADFEAEAEKHVHNLKVEAAQYVKTEMDTQKRLQNKLDFNDLIEMVGRAVLQNADETLSRQLKKSFAAVMVDEFQDTDALQYTMFSRLFDDGTHLFYMIGDPKQAIYAFRGADVFSYFAAAKNTRSAYGLSTNWRSAPNLIHAVNHVFLNREKAPFVVNDIAFTSAVASPANAAAFDEAPLVIWYLDSRREDLGGKPVIKSDKIADYTLSDKNASQAVIKTVAQEIMRLLNENGELQPKDIAVLVNDNHEGRLVYKTLEEYGIPATLSATEGVFETGEAKELLLILESVSQPDNLQKLKAAYTGFVLGGLSSEYLAESVNEDLWLNRLQKMRRWHKIYSERGFLSMFLNMAFGENSFVRLLTAANGRRRITNFIHLAELLHNAAQANNLTPGGLARYLHKAVSGGGVSDESALRLETDGDVVQILTVHKSKGLEYKIVFYPFAWDGVRAKKLDVYKYHNRNNVSLGFDETEPEFKTYLRESLAERLRLLYVALTRAKQRCYVGYGRVKTGGNAAQDKFETAALTYLLTEGAIDADDKDLAGRMKTVCGGETCNDEHLRAALENMARRANNRIKVLDLPLSGNHDAYAAPVDSANVLKTISRTVGTDWKVASFSSLTKITGVTDDVFEGRDLEQDTEKEPPVTKMFAPAESAPEPFGIFGLPKGAHVGNFFHDLLENTDFATAAQTPDVAMILAKLNEYNLDERFAPAIGELLINLCNANLAGSHDDIALKNVTGLLKEMEFYFPLKKVSQEKLRELFTQSVADIDKSFAAQAEKFVFAPAEGYLKGFVDLTFCYNGRYYILDWKSNYEGALASDYNPQNLCESVARHSYFLQYYLYTLALCQYLRVKLPNFKYNRDFGGVFYIYLRGFAVKQNDGEDQGVFRDKPPLAIINALGHTLVTGFMDFEE